MNLPRAIEQFLKSFEAEVSFLEIADAMNAGGRYRKTDGTKVHADDIENIVRNYTDYFIVSSTGVLAKMRGSGRWTVDKRQAFRLHGGYLGYFGHAHLTNLILNFIGGIGDLHLILKVSLEIIIKTTDHFSIVIHSEKVKEIVSVFRMRPILPDIIAPIFLSKTAQLIYGDSIIEFEKGLSIKEIDLSPEQVPEFIELDFKLDPEVLEDMSLIYFELAAKIKELAQLHRNCHILLRDNRTEPHQQNIFYFPEGVLYTFYRMKEKSNFITPPQFELIYDNAVNGNNYQIAFACYDAGADPTFVSSANKWTLNQAGPMANGVIDGLLVALKRYIKEEFLKNFEFFKCLHESEKGYAFAIDDSENPDPRKQFEFRKSEVKRALIMVCAVKCDETILEPLSGYSRYEPISIGKEIKKEIEEFAFRKLVTEPEVTLKFLTRFLRMPSLDSILNSANISD